MSNDRLWRAVGGGNSGGLVVREGKELTSTQVPERLARGALVRELEFLNSSGGRLHYELLYGTGPPNGWISVCLHGKALAELLPEEEQGPEESDAPEAETNEDVVSVRLIVDADTTTVAVAVARTLLSGSPKTLSDHAVDFGELGWRPDGRGLPLPQPVAQEWQAAAASSQQFTESSVWQGGWFNSQGSFSLGLRPLLPTESIWPHNWSVDQGYNVDLITGSSSHFCARPLTQQGGKTAPRSFFIKISSNTIGKAVLDSGFAVGGFADFATVSTIACLLHVRPVANGCCTEITRLLLRGSLLVDAVPGPKAHGKPDFSNPVPLLASQVIFMLEMEARAWLASEGFPLLEVWRGVRQPIQWAVFSTFGTVGSYTYAVGHAASSRSRRFGEVLVDSALAGQVEELLPNDVLGDRREKGGQFVEGFVGVKSFAELLARICRRASDPRQIFRRFVDLGSGMGHAVLAAHALCSFVEVAGCELDSELVRLARSAARRYVSRGLAAKARCRCDPTELFVQGDFLSEQFDWSNASVVFANAVTWPSSLLREVGRQALRLKRGSVVLLAVRQLPVDDIEVLQGFDVRGDACLMNFSGMNSVHLWAYQRR